MAQPYADISQQLLWALMMQSLRLHGWFSETIIDGLLHEGGGGGTLSSVRSLMRPLLVVLHAYVARPNVDKTLSSALLATHVVVGRGPSLSR